MPDNKQLRQTAFVARIADLKGGRYVKEEGWEPNYILTKNAKISRTNVIGVIISKADSPDANFKNIIIDDGSGNINVRNFENNDMFTSLNVGDTVLIVGRPREFSNEKYILPEIIRKIENKRWLLYRKGELNLFDLRNNDYEATAPAIHEETDEEFVKEESMKESVADRIVKFVKNNDKGKGVDMEEIVNYMKNPECENIIQFLLKQGEIFELMPGKVKVLE